VCNPFLGKPVQGFVPEVACECTIDCGDDCLNRILRIECCDTKIRGRDASGDQCICAIGGKCMNRAIQSRKYAKTEPFREFQMGFGLRAKVSSALIFFFFIFCTFLAVLLCDTSWYWLGSPCRNHTPFVGSFCL
jgi:hypothetical protein